MFILPFKNYRVVSSIFPQKSEKNQRQNKITTRIHQEKRNRTAVQIWMLMLSPIQKTPSYFQTGGKSFSLVAASDTIKLTVYISRPLSGDYNCAYPIMRTCHFLKLRRLPTPSDAGWGTRPPQQQRGGTMTYSSHQWKTKIREAHPESSSHSDCRTELRIKKSHPVTQRNRMESP